jgi:hypothetical protein
MGTKIHSYKERYNLENYTQEVFENIKGVIRIHKSEKDRQHNAQKKSTKGQTSIYETYI